MKYKNLHNYIISVLIITAMVGIAEITGNNEIIFPEIAAICMGALILPGFPWVVDGKRMIVFITLCAICGVLIVCFIPAPLWIQMLIAYAVSQVIFLLSKTTMAPMISAIVLPVMLQTRSIIYIISAFLLTTFVVIIRWVMEKKGLKLSVVYRPVDSLNKESIFLAFIRVVVISIFIGVVISFGYKFMVAPPMLVAFTEFTKKGNKAVNKPVLSVILIALCGFVGAISRYVFTIIFDFPLTLAAFVAIIVVLLLIRDMKMFIPPAAAMGILPMLIDKNAIAWYPIQVLIGITVLMLLAKGINNIKNIRAKYTTIW